MFHDVEPIPHPPTLPVPKHAPRGQKRPLSPRELSPRYRTVSPVFPIICKLYVVYQEIAAVYRAKGDDRPIPEKVSLAFLEEKYHKLLECMGEVKEESLEDGKGPIHLIVF